MERAGLPARCLGRRGCSTAAQVKHFSGSHELESVAYLGIPSVYVTIILSSKTGVAQKDGQLAFAELVRNYHFSTVIGGVVKE